MLIKKAEAHESSAVAFCNHLPITNFKSCNKDFRNFFRKIGKAATEASTYTMPKNAMIVRAKQPISQMPNKNPARVDVGVTTTHTIRAITMNFTNNLARADHRYFGAFLISKHVKAIPEFFDSHQFKLVN